MGSLIVSYPALWGAGTVDPDQPSSLNSNPIVSSSEKGSETSHLGSIIWSQFLCLCFSFHLLFTCSFSDFLCEGLFVLLHHCLHMSSRKSNEGVVTGHPFLSNLDKGLLQKISGCDYSIMGLKRKG